MELQGYYEKLWDEATLRIKELEKALTETEHKWREERDRATIYKAVVDQLRKIALPEP